MAVEVWYTRCEMCCREQERDVTVFKNKLPLSPGCTDLGNPLLTCCNEHTVSLSRHCALWTDHSPLWIMPSMMESLGFEKVEGRGNGAWYK